MVALICVFAFVPFVIAVVMAPMSLPPWSVPPFETVCDSFAVLVPFPVLLPAWLAEFVPVSLDPLALLAEFVPDPEPLPLLFEPVPDFEPPFFDFELWIVFMSGPA